MTTPTDIVNRAFDQIGRSDLCVGDMEDGTEGSQVALRMYSPALRQLLRASHWTFARKMAPLIMLADATGNTDDVGSNVIAPWVYEYGYPIDCMKVRFIPLNYLNPNTTPSGNIALPATPATTVNQPPYGYGMRLAPAPFLISQDTNYPVDDNSNWEDTIGTSPGGRLVILTNVNQAMCVYTSLMVYPSLWDPLFEQALVALLTARMALPLAKNEKFGIAVQDRADKAVMSAVTTARAASANESSFPQTTDNIPDFIRTRSEGASASGPNGGFLGGYDGPGSLWGTWDGLALGNGSIF